MLPLKEEEEVAMERVWVCREGLQGQMIRKDKELVTRPGEELAG